MDENPKISGRKQWQRSQKYKRKPQDRHGGTASQNSAPSSSASSSDPQPQRANRRQRNDAATPTVNNSITDSSTTQASADNKDTIEKENVSIDFSNLKRETEEIAKLTKKFTKRNISSNWHRYSVPEGAENDGEAEEEGPADFSALIQVSASKGRHFQLKEEQEWSSASGEQLGGYFALNLKRLSHSLACVPIYKQLRLPIHMFTEEELRHFDDLAHQASKAYNPDEIDPNIQTNLLQRETDVIEKANALNDNNTSNDYNILVDHESTRKLLNIDLEPKISPEIALVANSGLQKSNHSLNETNKTYFKTIRNDENSVQAEINCLNDKKQVLEIGLDNVSLTNSCIENNNSKTDNIYLTGDKSFSNTKIKITEDQPVSQTQITEGFVQTVDNKIYTAVKEEIPKIATKEISPVNNSSEFENTITSEPKDKRTKDRRKPSVKDTNDKPNSRETSVKLEDDDDDLDFLLSLKKSVAPEKNKGLQSIKNYVSSALAGSRTASQTSSNQPNSELDDWLDSVLQD